MLDFDKITVCVDMAGCPNRCRHCWLGVTDNKGVSIEQLRKMANDFREQAKQFEILSWYREPDFRGDYQSLWELEKQLSTEKTPHFELASFWRLVRDDTYVKWLYERNVKKFNLHCLAMRIQLITMLEEKVRIRRSSKPLILY